MNNDTPCNAEQRAAIVKAAQDRASYLRWLADKLLHTTDTNIRREAAKALMQLAEGK
jgi:hypothetical protein